MFKLALIFIVERGYLESQALLLAKSVKMFAEKGVALDMFGCSVRESNYPDITTVKELEKMGATVICENLNKEFDYFPLCNGIYASAYIESMYPEYDGYLLVDTDTLFLGAIQERMLEMPALIMRIVDNKGIGSNGEKDPNDYFWQQSFDFFGMDLLPVNVKTTVRKELIRPYYNSGFVLAFQLEGFMNAWKKDFLSLMRSDIRTSASASRHRQDYGFIEQFTLSVTSKRFEQHLKLAPETINYPLPFKPKIQDRPGHPVFQELIHVHYHRWFQHPGFLDYVTTDEDKKSLQYQWLKKRVPLKPFITGPFKC